MAGSKIEQIPSTPRGINPIALFSIDYGGVVVGAVVKGRDCAVASIDLDSVGNEVVMGLRRQAKLVTTLL